MKYQPHTLVMQYIMYSFDKHIWSLWYYSFSSHWKPLFQCFVNCLTDPQTTIFSTMKQFQPTTWEILTYSS